VTADIITYNKCWNCGSTMAVKKKDEVGHEYYECQKCGTTDTKLPRPGASALAGDGGHITKTVNMGHETKTKTLTPTPIKSRRK
jgi:DNA-directed RNA polymerase subunit M/transcription elongation factor TFIIS